MKEQTPDAAKDAAGQGREGDGQGGDGADEAATPRKPPWKSRTRRLKGLEEAKKALAEKVAEAENRRDEIAKLEDAEKKIGELIKKEKNVADKAKEKADKPTEKDAGDLAKKQAEVTPPTKDLGKELKDSVPRGGEEDRREPPRRWRTPRRTSTRRI